MHIVKNCLAAKNKAFGFYSNHQPGQAAIWYNNRAFDNKANFDMTEGSETWELDSKGKVVDICGTREVLYFNFGHKYSNKITTDCNMYGTEGNLFSANIPEENNKYNSWKFRNITLSDDDFLSLDYTQLAGERGEDGSLPETDFMKLNPNGPNYALLKTIEEKMQNFEIQEDGTITCKSGYTYKHENDIECSEKVSLEQDKTFFTNDSGINYYSCSLYNDVNNCLECSQKDICDKCQEDYNLLEGKTLCVKQSEIDDKIYNYDNNGILKLCSSMINGCYKCNNSTSCLECQSGLALLYDDTCLQKKIIEESQKYFKDELTNKYFSCSILDNCIKCTSKTVCASCKEGYFINNNFCEKISESDDDNNDLSIGAIIGIICGCLIIILILILFFIFRKKICRKNNMDNEFGNIEMNGENIKKEEMNEKEPESRTEKESVMIYSIKKDK